MGGLSKVAGVGTILYVIAAASKNTGAYGISEANFEHGKRLTDEFMKENTGDGDVMKNSIKGWWWKVMLDEKISPFYYKIKNVAKEGVRQAVNYAIPIGLAIGAIWGGTVSPLFAAGLALLGARAFLCDIVGIGEEK